MIRRWTLPSGFTLTELLAVIAVVAIVVAISLPALQEARLGALEGAALAHQRQSGVALTLYTTDTLGAFPYYGVPGTDMAPLKYHDGSLKGRWVYGDERGWYWGHPHNWAYFLDARGYDSTAAITGPEFDYKVFRPQVNAYDILSHTAFANPRYFDSSGDPSIADHAGQRIQNVRFPALKGILLRHNFVRAIHAPGQSEAEMARYRNSVWFADGHSGMHANHTLRPAAPIPGWMPRGAPVLTTLDGLLGRDL